MVRYYLQANLIHDVETYSLEDSPIELQDDGNGGLWYPKCKSIFLKSLNRDISVNWNPTYTYNYYYCDFEYGDIAMREYVELLLKPLEKTIPFYNRKRTIYILSKELD